MSVSPSKSPSKQPTKYAGQGAPDAAFYATTFKKDMISRKELVRGLHIDNHLARQIDNFIDDKLREDSIHADITADRATKFWEFDHGKSTQFEFDGIYRALLVEFECFQMPWMLNNNIPWCWQVAAVRIWVRNNRMDMVRSLTISRQHKYKQMQLLMSLQETNPRLQSAFGGHVRRYYEEMKDQEGSPTKRLKATKKALKLIDQGLEVSLFQQVPIGEDHADSTQVARIRIEPDPEYRKILIRPVDIIRQQPSAGGPDDRYLENGDVNPTALDLAKLLRKCKMFEGTQGNGSIVFMNGKEPKAVEDDDHFGEAIDRLHEKNRKEDLLPLMFVAGLDL